MQDNLLQICMIYAACDPLLLNVVHHLTQFMLDAQPPYKVELSNPKKTVLVEVMKATAAISVVEDYKLLGKLNLRELSMIGVEVDKKDDTLSNAAEKPEAVLAADAATKGQTLADSADPKQSNVVPSPTSKVIAPDKPEQKR